MERMVEEKLTMGFLCIDLFAVNFQEQVRNLEEEKKTRKLNS